MPSRGTKASYSPGVPWDVSNRNKPASSVSWLSSSTGLFSSTTKESFFLPQHNLVTDELQVFTFAWCTVLGSFRPLNVLFCRVFVRSWWCTCVHSSAILNLHFKLPRYVDVHVYKTVCAYVRLCASIYVDVRLCVTVCDGARLCETCVRLCTSRCVYV